MIPCTDFVWVFYWPSLKNAVFCNHISAGSEGCAGHGTSAAWEVHVSAEWHKSSEFQCAGK